MTDEHLAEFFSTCSYEIFKRAAHHRLRPYGQQVFIELGDTTLRKRFIESQGSRLDYEVQKKLADDPDPNVRGALAESPWLPEDIQDYLSYDQSYKVRRNLASPRCLVSRDIRLRLIRDDNVHVAAQAIWTCREKFDISVWEQAASRNGAVIRSAIIGCSYAPKHMRQQLIQASDAYTIGRIMDSIRTLDSGQQKWVVEKTALRLTELRPSRTSQSALAKLLVEHRKFLSGKLLDNLAEVFHSVADSDVWFWFSNHERTRAPALTRILEKEHDDYYAPRILKGVLSNPRCQAKHLKMMVQRYPKERLAMIQVAEHRAAPAKALEMLAGSRSRKVRHAVAENRNTPAHVLRELARSADLAMLETLSLNPNTPTDAIDSLASHELRDIRLGVAAHPKTSEHHLILFAMEPDQRMANVASYNLQLRRQTQPAGEHNGSE